MSVALSCASRFASPGRTSKKKSNVEPARPLPDGSAWPVVNVPLMPAPCESTGRRTKRAAGRGDAERILVVGQRA